MKIYKVEFNGLWGVPHGLIISADTKEQAFEVAREEIHWEVLSLESIREVHINKDKPTIIFFESGDY